MRPRLLPPLVHRSSILVRTGLLLLAGILRTEIPAAQAQPSLAGESPGSRYRDRVVFEADFRLEQQLAFLIQLRNSGRWHEAAELTQELLAGETAPVVEAEPHRFLGLRTWLQGELANWPEEGLAAFRELVDAAASAQFADALSRRDLQSMRAVADDYFGSSIHDDACWQLAHWAWEDGDLALAESYWARLLSRNTILADSSGPLGLAALPECDYAPEDVMARLALCRVFLRGRHESGRAIEAYRTQFPTAAGTLAGVTGPYSETLEQLHASLEAWQPRGDRLRNESSSPIPFQSIVVQGLSWSRKLTGSDSQSLPLPTRPKAMLHGDTLVLLTLHEVRVLDLSTGDPFWPTGEADDAGVVYSNVAEEQARRPILPGAGVLSASGVVANGKVFATLGWPILIKAEGESRAVPSRVACLDLARGEGRIDWIADDSNVLPENWRFSGEAVVIDNQLFVPTTTSTGPIALGIASIDARNGTLRWHRQVCGVTDPRPGRLHAFGRHLLCVSNDHIVWSTPFECVLRIDPRAGDVVWAVSYPSSAHSTASRGGVSETSCPIVRGGVIFVAGVDGRSILAIDEIHGIVRWSQTLPERVTHVIGEQDGILVVGGQSLWGIAAASGELLWKCGFNSPEGYGAGLGLIAGQTAWWTTRDTLFGTDLGTGELIARHEIQQAWGLNGGDLVAAPKRLLILEAGRVSAVVIRSPAR
jgi:outer membrane protein assembly factor BamB